MPGLQSKSVSRKFRTAVRKNREDQEFEQFTRALIDEASRIENEAIFPLFARQISVRICGAALANSRNDLLKDAEKLLKECAGHPELLSPFKIGRFNSFEGELRLLR